MDLKETGKIIATNRKIMGYTQQSLADALMVSDKAVSKWERGLCLPDSSLLSKLSMLLDIDIEYIIAGSKPYGHHQWNGFIKCDDLNHTVAGKPLVHYLVSYLMLVGIKNIYFDTDDKNYIRNLNLQQFGLNISFGTPYLKDTMIIYEKFFLFGANMTRYFESCMSDKNNLKLLLDDAVIPIIFAHDDGSSVEQYKINQIPRQLCRGTVYIPIDSEDALNDTDTFIKIYEKHHKKTIADLNELALLRGLK